MRTKRIIVLSDPQIPYHDKRVLGNVYDFIRAYGPDELASVGDDVDFPQVSRWNRGMEGEYRGDLQKHVDAGVLHFERLREVHSGPIHVMRSNHMDRPLNYVRKHAPGLLGLKALTIPSLLEFDRLEVTYHEQPYELAPGWFLLHGDEGSLIRTAGGTALGLARKIGASVVCGHTHRAGIQHEHQSVSGRVRGRLYGMEVGNLMDMRQADYLKAGTANWQQGFGILYVEARNVTPSLILIQPNGSFIVEGQTYGRNAT